MVAQNLLPAAQNLDTVDHCQVGLSIVTHEMKPTNSVDQSQVKEIKVTSYPFTEWEYGAFRDCNGVSNGTPLPPETVAAEAAAGYKAPRIMEQKINYSSLRLATNCS